MAWQGVEPRWRRDQRELYFLSAENRLLAVPANLGEEAKLGVASPLFTVLMPANTFGWGAQQYDVSADGRFLAAIVEAHVPDRLPVTVAFNATAGQKPGRIH